MFGASVTGMLVSAVVAAVVCSAGWRFRRPARPEKEVAWPAVAALGLAYAAGHAVVVGLPSPRPIGPIQWSFVATLAGAGLGLAEAGWSPRLRGAARALLLGAALFAVLRPSITYSWDLTQTVVWLSTLWLAALAFWVALDRSLGALPGPAGWVCLTLLSGSCAVALASSGGAGPARLAACSAASAAGVLLGSASSGGRPFVRSAVPVAGMSLTIVLLAGCADSTLPLWSAALLAVSPACAGATHGWIARRGSSPTVVVPLLAMAVPLVVAMVIAWWSAPLGGS